MSDEKCIRIEMEYENGKVFRAVGDEAEKINKWIGNATLLQYLHGAPYKGPVMKEVEKCPQ